MKAVILAAGEGTRMRPLTLRAPKPLLTVAGKPLIEHLVSSLPAEITEIIMVVGYLADKIKDYCGHKFLGRRIIYVSQKDNKAGTFNALECCEHYLSPGRFLLLCGDDLHSPKSLRACVDSKELSVLLARVENPERFGVALVDAKGVIKEIEEKPKQPKSNLVNCGPAVLNKKILDYPPPRSHTGEYYVTDSINLMIKDGYKFYGVEADWWIPIGYPEDLKKAEEFLKNLKISE